MQLFFLANIAKMQYKCYYKVKGGAAMETTTGNRMKQRRKELGLSAETIAEYLNVSPATIYRYEKGEIEKMPGKILEPLSIILRTTPAYLMGWTDEVAPQKPLFSNAENIIPLPTTYSVPLLGEIACGKPILAEENVEGMVKVPEYIQADFALRCKGDSMIGARILDGDIVYIRQQPDVDDGEIAAVLIDNEATLKRVYKMPGRLQLRAENPAFLPINLEGDELESVRILGKAVAFTSSVK